MSYNITQFTQHYPTYTPFYLNFKEKIGKLLIFLKFIANLPEHASNEYLRSVVNKQKKDFK